MNTKRNTQHRKYEHDVHLRKWSLRQSLKNK